MSKPLVPDELWEVVRPMLPKHRRKPGRRGRPPVDDRAALGGILFVLKTGIPWQALPAEAFGVSGSSCWRRFSEWTTAGVWPRLHRRLLNRLGKAGGVNLDRVVADSQSRAKKGARTPAPTPRTAPSKAANATC